jgi:hypothetical protein
VDPPGYRRQDSEPTGEALDDTYQLTVKRLDQRLARAFAERSPSRQV